MDSAGRFRQEVFGNDAVTARSYFSDKQSLKSIVTQHGAAKVQDLAYDYDARLDLKSRTDALQPQNPTERFRYDPLERLTCAYFSVTESASYACEYAYGYKPDGNISVKADTERTMTAWPLDVGGHRRHASGTLRARCRARAGHVPAEIAARPPFGPGPQTMLTRISPCFRGVRPQSIA